MNTTTPTPGTPARAAAPRAFTLVEMVTSCAILSLLMLALGYGLKLALVSTGTGAAQAVATLDAAEVVERVTDDLNEAIDFTEQGGESVTFTVPARGPATLPAAAGTPPTPDEVSYKWWPAGGLLDSAGNVITGLLSGPGDATEVPAYAVTRRVNRGPVSVVARDVRQFRLDYGYRPTSPPPAAAADRVLVQHDPPPAIGSPFEFQLSTSRQMGETFRPALASGTTSYSITRIALYVRADATLDGLLLVRVVNADQTNNVPLTTQVLDEAWVPEVALTDTAGWVDVPFTKLTSLSPSLKYCVLVAGSGPAGPYHAVIGYVRHATSVTPDVLAPNTYMVQMTSATGSWTTSSLNSLRYKIYGVTSP